MHQRLMSASLAAAVALGAAACGTASSQTAQPGSSSPVTQQAASTTAPATNTVSSAAPQANTATSDAPAADTAGSSAPTANSAFPYEPGGVTYSGDQGGVATFSIPAGKYSENTMASYDPANDPSGTGECLFSGELDYLTGTGWSVPVGVTVPITAQVPIDGPPVEATYPAGNYRLYIYGTTTCSWTFELWR
jgi:hypothetical protein